MSKRYLFETATLPSTTVSEDGTWKVRLISEGKGSSGTYTRSLLEGHYQAFNDVLSFKNHPSGWDGPQDRDFTMIAGEIVGETWVEEDEQGRLGIYGRYLPDPEYKDKLERYKNKLALSIFIEGSGYEDESGNFVIDWFNPLDPYASVDVVIAGGARGRFEESAAGKSMKELYESAVKAGLGKDSVTVAELERSTKVEKRIEALTMIVEDTLKAVEALVAEKQVKDEAVAQAKVDSEAVAVAVEHYDAAVKAVDKAELFESQKEAILAEAKAGRDVVSLIESAVKVKEEALEAVKVSESDEVTGAILGESVTRFGAWA